VAIQQRLDVAPKKDTVKDFIKEGETFDYSTTPMIKWAVKKGYLSVCRSRWT